MTILLKSHKKDEKTKIERKTIQKVGRRKEIAKRQKTFIGHCSEASNICGDIEDIHGSVKRAVPPSVVITLQYFLVSILVRADLAPC